MGARVQRLVEMCRGTWCPEVTGGQAAYMVLATTLISILALLQPC